MTSQQTLERPKLLSSSSLVRKARARSNRTQELLRAPANRPTPANTDTNAARLLLTALVRDIQPKEKNNLTTCRHGSSLHSPLPYQ